MGKHSETRKFKLNIAIIVVCILAGIIFLGISIVQINKINSMEPEITLLGDDVINLNLGEDYKEEGVIAKILDDEVNSEISGGVDTNMPGEYIIKYVATSRNGKKRKIIERKVIVKDNIEPIIKLNGEETIQLTVGDTYEEAGANANDNIDGELTDKVQIDGNVDTQNDGTYEITYTVKDKAGNSAQVKRKVVVNKKETRTSTRTSGTGLPVLMYHFFYDKNKSKGRDSNWMEISDFEEQMKYLADNGFYFPTWEEVEKYVDGEITLPKKSVVITVDDGDDSFFELAIPIIQKYNVKATTFVITSWYGYRANSKAKNISYQSHSDDMHQAANGKGVMQSWSYDKMIKDVKISSNTLGGATIFCYPFGQYNDLCKKMLKDAGYKLAFTTAEGRVRKGQDKYALPRVRTLKGMSMEKFIESVN